MDKLRVTNILHKNVKIEAVKLTDKNDYTSSRINETKLKQAEILRLKEVDQERLRMIVQL